MTNCWHLPKFSVAKVASAAAPKGWIYFPISSKWRRKSISPSNNIGNLLSLEGGKVNFYVTLLLMLRRRIILMLYKIICIHVLFKGKPSLAGNRSNGIIFESNKILFEWIRRRWCCVITRESLWISWHQTAKTTLLYSKLEDYVSCRCCFGGERMNKKSARVE